MQQQTQHLLETVVLENSNDAVGLSVQMIQLKTVQNAIAQLMVEIDEITEKGWHEDPGMAYLSILKIQDTVRLIDMAFFPLFKEISEEVNAINMHAQELYETVIKNEAQQEATLSNC
ncbi:hypothetical protein [Lysinibacillus sp. BPa_S21]|uniref:hypothetical protein n=1 Tax=Lysinibacillus sp. BPa_S21 TaxID=2932478 RepID=UPI002012E076|nr:hypothetical protein [Lysinibacillus sp. BPa_S21]MCL1696544.1 hypothetical protein [Lysinibacillus sp. BPa_S21]